MIEIYRLLAAILAALLLTLPISCRSTPTSASEAARSAREVKTAVERCRTAARANDPETVWRTLTPGLKSEMVYQMVKYAPQAVAGWHESLNPAVRERVDEWLFSREESGQRLSSSLPLPLVESSGLEKVFADWMHHDPGTIVCYGRENITNVTVQGSSAVVMITSWNDRQERFRWVKQDGTWKLDERLACADGINNAAKNPPPPEPIDKERLKKALAVYRKFPPPEWGPLYLQKLQKRNLSRGGPMAAREREFVLNIELWMIADQYVKDRDRDEGKGGASPEQKR